MTKDSEFDASLPDESSSPGAAQEPHAAIDEAWLESLLFQMLQERPEANASRLAALRQKIAEQQASPRVPAVRRWKPYLAYAAAACLLLLGGLIYNQVVQSPQSSTEALAAVERTLVAKPGYRQYRLHMLGRRSALGNGAAEKEAVAQLYISPSDQFVCVHPGWLGLGEAIIGGDRANRWVVPRFGPVLVGGEEWIGGWLAKKDIASPYFHLATILERMKKAYRLELLKDEVVPLLTTDGQLALGTQVKCQHFRGISRVSNRSLPSTIDFWADQETGIARKAVLHWEANGNGGTPRTWTFEQIESGPNSEANTPEWFGYEYHNTNHRRVIHVGSKRDLDSLEVPER